ncbi:MAG: methylated-DNA--[protein]-cysteine S-methyltransferase [Gammaproteobacteria bacterium]|nr:methylated-DNA--[protein]-cysteine S-methyltransferase [Gammaproteobacteria bacterium]
MTTSPLTAAHRHYQVVARAIDYIRSNARRQPTLAEVAATVHLSEQHLQRVFAEWAGISPKRFLQFLTKEHARLALRRSADLLSVSLESGLSGPGRLHDLMVSCEAMTPGEIKALGGGVTLGYGLGETPFGVALIGWSERGVCHLAFCDDSQRRREAAFRALWPSAELRRDDTEAMRLCARIFAEQPESGKLHLLLRGTNYQIKVWEALLDIGPAQLVSYSQLAALIDTPGAQRAVGSAVAANAIAYLIPCHRIIRANGDSGDYHWGESRKLAIHAWEAGRRGITQR